jgi:hypothetical protein
MEWDREQGFVSVRYRWELFSGNSSLADATFRFVLEHGRLNPISSPQMGHSIRVAGPCSEIVVMVHTLNKQGQILFSLIIKNYKYGCA